MNLVEQLASLRKAKNNAIHRKERSEKQEHFTDNPFLFTKKLIEDKISGRLDFPREEVEDPTRNVHSDKNRKQDMGVQSIQAWSLTFR
ncbi:hypothetical protein DPMN_128229 [Dreissena polymorpha]|uniref:Uncharacterized protein n=1 Tax=Dreissena polymorpha TaxID=45954 RepID=A0A9D4GZ51_DREPO|nr:hypothetical protein DPMN_128229 [Dreissena polymorpha]